MSAGGETQRFPQTPGDAIADAQVFVEKGLLRFEAYLGRWADFQVWLEQQDVTEKEAKK